MNFIQALIEADKYLGQASDTEKIAWLDEKIANCGQYGQAGTLIESLLTDWRGYLVFVNSPESNEDKIAEKWPWAVGWSGQGLPPYILQGLLNVRIR